MPLALRVESEVGHAYELPYLDLRVVAAGSESAHANNEHQPIPFKFSFNFKSSGATEVSWFFQLENVPIYWYREFLRFRQVLESPVSMILTSLNDGLRSLAKISGDEPRGHIEPSVLALLDRLIQIQQKTGSVIRVPNRPFLDQADVDAIEWIESVLVTGRQPAPPSDFRFTVYDQLAADLIEKLREHPLHVRAPRHVGRLLDTDIDLGPVLVTCPAVDVALIDKQEADGRSTFEYKIVARNGYELDVLYERFKSAASSPSTSPP